MQMYPNKQAAIEAAKKKIFELLDKEMKTVSDMNALGYAAYHYGWLINSTKSDENEKTLNNIARELNKDRKLIVRQAIEIACVNIEGHRYLSSLCRLFGFNKETQNPEVASLFELALSNHFPHQAITLVNHGLIVTPKMIASINDRGVLDAIETSEAERKMKSKIGNQEVLDAIEESEPAKNKALKRGREPDKNPEEEETSPSPSKFRK